MRRKTSGLARILNFVLLSIAWVTMVAAFPNTAVASVSFQSVVAYDAGAPCLNSVVAADVNADGKPDVLTVGGCPDINYQGLPGSVSVLLSNGDGTFQPAVLYASGGVNTTSLQVADVNGDGKPDVVATSLCSTPACPMPVVSVLLGNGNGTFQPAVTYNSGLEGISLAVADLNKDGKLDLVLAGYYWHGGTPGSISVLLGNGDGTFQTYVTYGSGQPVSVALSDVNGDGKLDALVTILCSDAYCKNGFLAVLLGNGDGTFQSQVTYDAGYQPGSLAVADVNGDGKADALFTKPSTPFTNEVHSSVGVLLGKGDGTFGPMMSYDSGAAAAQSLAVADVNLDGRPDVVVAHCTQGTSTGYSCPSPGNGVVGILLGNGDGTFQPAVRFLSGGRDADFVVLADINGDRRVDVVVANQVAGYAGSTNGAVGILVNTTKPTTSTTLASSLNPSIYGQTVTFTAHVTNLGPVPPTGTVVFMWKYFTTTYTIGTATLDSAGVATLTKSSLNAASYPMIAVYRGDTINSRSTSPVLNQTVLQTTSAAALTSSVNPSKVGQAITFTAKFTSPTVIPSGPVTFKTGTTVLGTAQLNSGKAIFTTSTLPAGTTIVKVIYNGNSNIKGSSASVTQTVQP